MSTATRSTITANTRPEPDPARLAGLLVRAWVEVRFGRRCPTQLAALVSPALLLRLRAPARVHDGPLPTVRRITATRPAPGVCEAVVTLTWASERVTAVAVRLERRQGQWRAVELLPPEAGARPPVTAASPPCARAGARTQRHAHAGVHAAVG